MNPVRTIFSVLSSLCCAASVFAQIGTQAVTPSPDARKPKYTSTLIGDHGYNLRVGAFNNKGEITGSRSGSAFIYKEGSLKVFLPEPLNTGDYAYGSAINDAGDVAGTVQDANGLKAFLYSGGTVKLLDLGAQVFDLNVTGINSSGQVVGGAYAGGKSVGFLYQNGATTLIPGLPLQGPNETHFGTSVAGINSRGEIVGNTETHSFLYTHGLTLDIGGLPKSLQTLAVGLDSSGRAIGYSLGGPDNALFIYGAGKFTVLPISEASGGALVKGINDCGEVVGSGPNGPYLFSRGAVTLLAPYVNTFPVNTSNFTPVGINNHGQIIGQVTFTDSGGGYGILLLNPSTPETCGTDTTIVNTASVSTVGPKEDIGYTINVENVKVSPTHFTVSDALGIESRLLSCEIAGTSGSCNKSADGRTVLIDLPDLARGTTATIALKVHIAGTSGDNQLVMNTATLNSASRSSVDYLSTAYTNIRLTADLSIAAKLLSDESGLLHYRATVTDTGPNNSHAALLLDPLPANTSFVSVSTSAGKCSFHPTIGPNGAVRCPLGNLTYLVPATVDVVLKASPAACPSLTNTFSLTSKSIDSNGSNDTSTVVTPLSGSECISGMANR